MNELNKARSLCSLEAVEHLYVVLRGEIIGHNVGTQFSVACPEGVQVKDAVIVHNHPYDDEDQSRHRLSFGDVISAAFDNALAIEAIWGNRYIRAERPAQGWPDPDTDERWIMFGLEQFLGVRSNNGFDIDHQRMLGIRVTSGTYERTVS